mmetsp:Transcript_39/g.116  ORF Transcript_39/g.116 Transcript_39/m.116 type:complete len:576 (-) Transcript_39:2263-3990(-)
MAGTDDTPEPVSRWTIVFAAALLNCLQAGTYFMMPTTLMPLIIKELNTSIVMGALPIALGKLAYVIMLFPGGALVDSLGPKRCIVVGFAGLAVVVAAYALFVSAFWQVIIAHILLAMFSSTSGVPVYAVIVASWFVDNLGITMGIVLAGFSFAGTAIPALLAPIANTFGWRSAMLVMCASLAFVALPISIFVLKENAIAKDAREDTDTISETFTRDVLTEEMEVAEKGFCLEGDMLYLFFLYACSYFLLQYVSGCFAENILYYLHIDRHVALPSASLFFATLNFAAFCAKLVAGYLGDRFDRFRTAVMLSTLTTMGIAMLFCPPAFPKLTKNLFAIWAFAVLFGFGYGSTFNALYSTVPLVFGKQALGRVQSMLFAIGLLGNALGSFSTGLLRTALETYHLPFGVSLSFSIVSTFILLGIATSEPALKIREGFAEDMFPTYSTENLFSGPSDDLLSAPSHDSVHAAHALYWNRRRNMTASTFVAMQRYDSTYSLGSETVEAGSLKKSTFSSIVKSGFIGSTMEFMGFESDLGQRRGNLGAAGSSFTERIIKGVPSASSLPGYESTGHLHGYRHRE